MKEHIADKGPPESENSKRHLEKSSSVYLFNEQMFILPAIAVRTGISL